MQGRVFMQQKLRSPVEAANQAMAGLRDLGVNLILADVHAEATSEKQAMGYHLEGRLQVLVGTHTHVPTADTQILPGGTAEEVVGAVLFLASSQANYILGEVIEVNGGILMD